MGTVPVVQGLVRGLLSRSSVFIPELGVLSQVVKLLH